MALPEKVGTLRRPKLLVRAARKGLALYRRERDIRAIFGSPPSPRALLLRLTEEEESIEQARIDADGTYSAARHIAVLTALIAEARNYT